MITALTAFILSPIWAYRPSTQGAPQTWACTAERIYEGNQVGHHQGWSLAADGDWNNDGRNDVLTGGFQRWDYPTTDDAATSILLFASSPTTVPTCVNGGADKLIDISSNPAHIADRFGCGVAFVGDLDGDLKDDFVVGAPRHPKPTGTLFNCDGASTYEKYGERGRLYVFLSTDYPSSQPTSPGQASVIVEGPTIDGSRFGYAVCGAGRFFVHSVGGIPDKPDVAVGAPGGARPPNDQLRGTVYVLSGASIVSIATATSATGDVVALSGVSNVSYSPGPVGDQLGFSLARLPSATTGGLDALVAGAPQYRFDCAQDGLTQDAHLYSGTGVVRVLRHDLGVALTFVGERFGDEFGFSVSACTWGSEPSTSSQVVIGAPRWEQALEDPELLRGKAYVYSVAPDLTSFTAVRTHEGTYWTPPPPNTPIGEMLGYAVGWIGLVHGADAVPDYGVSSRRYYSGMIVDLQACPRNPLACSGGTADAGNDPAAGRVQLYNGVTGSSFQIYVGEDQKDSAGWAMSPIGNLYGSSADDVIFTSCRWDSISGLSELGRIYVFER